MGGRVDLAACYRLAQSHGWNRNIYNHVSHRVPGEPDMFLIKPHVLLWDEITASNLIKVNMHGELDERAGVNRPGYVLHSAILRARPDVNAVVHIHEEASVAVSTMKDGLLPLTQKRSSSMAGSPTMNIRASQKTLKSGRPSSKIWVRNQP